MQINYAKTLAFLRFFLVSTALLPLFLPSCNEDNIASDTKTTCFGVVEGILFNR